MIDSVPPKSSPHHLRRGLLADAPAQGSVPAIADPFARPRGRGFMFPGGDPLDDPFCSLKICLPRFPPIPPLPGQQDWHECYKETLTKCAKEPDIQVRRAAVDAYRLYESHLAECAYKDEIVIAYDLFEKERFVVAGYAMWVKLLYGFLDKLTRILPLYLDLENSEEFENMIEAVNTRRGKCTCQTCEPGFVETLHMGVVSSTRIVPSHFLDYQHRPRNLL